MIQKVTRRRLIYQLEISSGRRPMDPPFSTSNQKDSRGKKTWGGETKAEEAKNKADEEEKVLQHSYEHDLAGNRPGGWSSWYSSPKISSLGIIMKAGRGRGESHHWSRTVGKRNITGSRKSGSTKLVK